MITAYTLFFFSVGNSIYVKDGKTEILIDAGKSALSVEKSLASVATSIENLSAIFVTHEHSDHVSALEVISKKYSIPIHITSPSLDFISRSSKYIQKNAVEHCVKYEQSIGSLHLSSFAIPHDSVQNVGYKITSDDGDTLGIATDMGHVTDEIKESLFGCKNVIVESNHDRDMLIYGKYPDFLKNRILSDNGHLSNEDCASLVCALANAGTINFTLAHLSRENNTPEAAFFASRNALDRLGFKDVYLGIASPTCAVMVTDPISCGKVI